MRQAPVTMTLSGTDMTVNVTSNPVNLISIYAYSVQVVWSSGSAPVGTFKLQASDDPVDAGGTPTNYTDVTSSSTPISGTPGSVLFDVTECSYRWVRLVYTATSGSATITSAVMNLKGV